MWCNFRRVDVQVMCWKTTIQSVSNNGTLPEVELAMNWSAFGRTVHVCSFSYAKLLSRKVKCFMANSEQEEGSREGSRTLGVMLKTRCMTENFTYVEMDYPNVGGTHHCMVKGGQIA